MPGAKQCSAGSSQTCDANGSWQVTSTCPYVCTGSGVCSGSCVPGSKQCSGNGIQTCDDSGAWQTTSSCPYVCDGGACAGTCVPGTTQCSGTQVQTCTASGQWGSASACAIPANGTSACSLGSCKITCSSGFDNCDGEAANGCEVDLKADSNNCNACNRSCCGGGACSTGVCQPVALPVYTTSNASYDVNDSDIYWSDPYSSGNLYKTPLVAGASTTSVVTGQQGGPSFIILTGSSVLFTNTGIYNNSTGAWDGGGAFATSLSGGTPKAYEVYAGNGEDAILSAGSSVIWLDVSRQSIKTRNVDKTHSIVGYPIADPTFAYRNVISDGTYLYAISNNSHGTIFRAPIHPGLAGYEGLFVAGASDGVAWTKFADSPNDGRSHPFMGLAIDGTNLYTIYSGDPTTGNLDGGVWKFPLNGSAGSQLVLERAYAPYISTDGVHVYYTVYTYDAQKNFKSIELRRIAVEGGAASTVADLGPISLLNDRRGPRLNGKCVFVAGGGPTSVVTVNKAP